ncbi:MAG: 50S ribosomal protein L25/general stress protein Ctc [Prevotella sp.]|nr:50S ribosomal protein L25/general stress protein Ctc [Prevotella sp.]MBQ9178461.1 50S ribosomal protein L25/general stress protein Ctc [Prevotella sp.]MBQ9670083.1 50S ribosomal protein L25/general stress protein Ctc [Prevotella sp.]MBR1525706.1 50S ribosomal protein L25/general stress protein Ctc [Prevotella sp.]MDY6229742.1 50S ribosomal protein L25/general stress protein Ctc [Prevotella sp.]
MKEFQLNGQLRTDFGKKASKMMRKEGLIPCNIYGEKKGENGLPEAIAFAIPMTELRKVVYTPHVYVCNINIEGKNHIAIMKELQFHPVTDALLHVDFYETTEEKPITIGIPVKLNGLAQGVRDGGRLALQIRKINVTAPYKNIPETLDIDVTNLGLGKSIKVGELSFEGLELATSKDVVVCTVKMTRAARSAADSANAQSEEAAE